ncbi:MAG: hypothetical protein ACYSWU_21470 [Planctomycetota bacterium]|jgi:hypothetical protein
MAKCKEGMVWRPRVTSPANTPAKRENRDAKGHAAAKRRGGPIGKQVKRAGAAARQQRKRAIKGKKKVMKAKAAARGGGSLVGSVGRKAGAAVMRTPVTAVLGAVAMAGVVAARVLTGRSFENMGQQVRKAVLGDIPEEAMADARTRAQISSPEVLAAYGNSGGEKGQVHGQLKKIFDMQRPHNLAREKGRRAFERSKAFQVDSMSDVVVMRLHGMWKAAWDASGAAAVYEWVEYLIAAIRAGTIGVRTFLPFGTGIFR